MTVLLSLTVDLITSTFYQKREQAGTAETVKKKEVFVKNTPSAKTYSVIKELTV
jgi:hypothetical protein